ncbi:cytoskeleton protein RodZ [Novimethylophilus kurashikiensis]|uniref:Cytoskeleton protein RodZ n=1 Tax=Novimethylophilus kurashikiensis TaxID=1825523 RepID=A0A2R5F2U3_9PROT|nr:RodZ domain-containing protein [Novimethylophilus kurashikiensis]GBG12887.1 cytoskeleton protein RodZ [Novimethylophilus kurashikiensis]
MSEEISVMENETPDVQPSRLGELLRTTREQLGLEVDDVARQLCLSPRQVVALEADAYSDLPSATFTRGFIRNYAKLLQIEAEPLLAMYRSKVPDAPSLSAISLHTEGIPIQTGNRGSWLPYLVATGILVLAAAAWWFYMDWRESHPAAVEPAENVAAPAKTESATTPVPLQAQPEPAPMGAGMQPEQLTEPAPNATLAQAEPAAPSVPSASPAPAAPAVPVATPSQTPSAAVPAPSNAVAAGIARVELKFSESSWVRVMDADGKELLNKTKPAASEEVVEGKPPLKVVIGNVNGATVIYKGQPVDVLSHAKANVARLTLE